MPGMANQNRFGALTAGARNFHMHFGYQRAGGIKEHRQLTRFSFSTHRLRHTVSREDQNRSIRHFTDLFDKNRTALTQAVYHIAVMHHFMTNVDRRSVELQRAFNNADRAINSRTKSSRISQ